jgi:hypothetical protein
MVPERFGHSSILITSQTYQHVRKGMQAGAAQKVADLIFGPRQNRELLIGFEQPDERSGTKNHRGHCIGGVSLLPRLDGSFEHCPYRRPVGGECCAHRVPEEAPGPTSGFAPALDIVDFGDVGHDNSPVLEDRGKVVSEAIDDLVVELGHRHPESFTEL